MTDHRSTKLERVLEVAELCHGTCYFLADLRAAERELQTCSATLEREDGDADLKIVFLLTAHGAEIEAWELELHSIETASVMSLLDSLRQPVESLNYTKTLLLRLL